MPKMEENEFRLIRHDEKIEDLERRMENIENDSKPLERLSILVEIHKDQFVLMNERFEKNFAKITDTLEGINENLSNVNHEVTVMKGDQAKIHERVGGLEQEQFSRLQKFQDRQIDTKYKIIGGIITGLILGGLIYLLGWK